MKKYFILYFLVTVNQIIAQTKVTLEEAVVITASNSKQKIKETGRNITIIPGELFSQLAINSVDELLKYSSGIEVQQRGPQGSQSDILIRGGSFQQVLILIDGVRLNDPLTGHFNGNIPIHPSAIERIEVLKGAASSVWGADAVGGVIHIITKAFANKINDNANFQTGFQFGQYGLLNANVAFNKTTAKNNHLSLGLLSNNAIGNQLRGTSAFFNNNTLHGAFSTQLKNNWQLNTKAIIDSRDFNAQNFYTTFKSDTAKETVQTFFSHVQLTKSWNNKSITNDFSYKTLNDEFQFNNQGGVNNNKTKQIAYQLFFQEKISDKLKYSTGFQVLNKSIVSNDRGNHNLWNVGGYLMLQHVLAKNWHLTEGARIDYNKSFGTVISPQVNLIYTPKNWALRAAFAQGIRDADFTERYNNYNKRLVTSGSIGNPNLKTESTWNMELGADYYTGNIKISKTLFYRNQSNLIDWAVTPYQNMPRQVNLIPTGNYALATNLSTVNTYGAEVDVNYNKTFSNQHSILINYNLTYLKSETNASTNSFYIIGHANWLSTLNTVIKINQFNIGLNSIFKSRPARNAAAINAAVTKDYLLLNTKLTYNFIKYKTNIFAQVTNITDKKYSDILGAQMPGRWISGGIQIEL
jgi:vitamin B12 transporter